MHNRPIRSETDFAVLNLFAAQCYVLAALDFSDASGLVLVALQTLQHISYDRHSVRLCTVPGSNTWCIPFA